MELSASLLDFKFLLLSCGLGLARIVWPRQHYVLFGALGSGLLVGMASINTLMVVSAISAFYLYPLHRLTRFLESRQVPAYVARLSLGAGVAGLVAALVVFKVDRSFAVPLLAGPRWKEEVVSIVGFSYFIFRAISFLHIQAILKFEERSPLTILYYTLFPQH